MAVKRRLTPVHGYNTSIQYYYTFTHVYFNNIIHNSMPAAVEKDTLLLLLLCIARNIISKHAALAVRDYNMII